MLWKPERAPLLEQEYQDKRHQIAQYFDKTAVKAWDRLTSNDENLNFIRESVRKGRERMQHHILERFGENLSGKSVLDAGCGTGNLAMDLVTRNANVVAVDISPSLIKIARERFSRNDQCKHDGELKFVWGDMLDPSFGDFDHIVLMDSTIHYKSANAIALVNELCKRANESIIFTFVPLTPLLAVKFALGKFFPKSERAPAVEPSSEDAICNLISQNLNGWEISGMKRVSTYFYASQAVELRRV
ncbi:magnesium protoporphyrin IX methyltransferase [Betaproteobacteria bacterium]|nr:magnesium protoporphyrin IX methyltransferase [Betaproteobacteria bacterium]